MFIFQSFFAVLASIFSPPVIRSPVVVKALADDGNIAGASWLDASSDPNDLFLDLSRSTATYGGRSLSTADKFNIQGGRGNDLIWGNAGANILQGGAGEDFISGRDGADTLRGDGGNDQLSGDIGDDVLYGGDGHDTLDGGAGTDTMRGGAGNDIYTVDRASDQVFEADGEGDDVIRVIGDYSLQSGQSVERIEAADPASTDWHSLGGNGLRQTIVGGSGRDTLDGGGGGDTLVGGKGDDRYVVYAASDTIVEAAGGGYDTVQVKGGEFRLAKGAEVERIELAEGDPRLVYGNEYGQVIVGNTANNIIDGGGGNDTLYGGDPTGIGAFLAPMFLGDYDIFQFSTPLAPDNVDRIVNFNNQMDLVTSVFSILGLSFLTPYRGHDTIRLSKAIFTEIGVGNLSESAFCNMATETVAADDRILYQQSTGSIFYDADGSGSTAAIKFAELNAGQSLKAQSFVVYA